MNIRRRDLLATLGVSLASWIPAKKVLAQSLPRIDFPSDPRDPRFPPVELDPNIILEYSIFINGPDFVCGDFSGQASSITLNSFRLSSPSSTPFIVDLTASPPLQTSLTSLRLAPGETNIRFSLIKPPTADLRRGSLRIRARRENGDYESERNVDIYIKQASGEWTHGGILDVVGIHAAMMPSGHVLFFGYNSRRTFVDERGRYQLWSPETRRPIAPSSELRDWNPFCSGHSFLGDGRLFVAGGFKFGDPFRSSSADKVRTVEISPSHETVTAYWNESYQKMQDKRWYPTCITLANGNSLILGGSAPFAADNWKDTDEDVEFFDLQRNELIRKDETRIDYPRDGRWSPRPGDRRQVVADGQRLVGLYSLTHLLPNVIGDDAPNGLLFVLTEMFARIYNPSTNLIVRSKIEVGGFRTWWTQGSSVLLPIYIDTNGDGPDFVRIMVIGGGSLGKGGGEGKDARAVSNVEIFRYLAKTRELILERIIRLNRPRFMGDSILLPDGNILVVGGASMGYANENSNSTLNAELINLSNFERPIIQNLSSSSIDRGYHATALLLPDASVLTAGGTCGWNNEPTCEQLSVSVFKPPYLSCGPRPEIISSPQKLKYNESFEIEVGEINVTNQIILIRCGSRTHSLDTDQRMLVLSARRQDNLSRVLQARTPRNRTYAPPGPYMMFVTRSDSHKVPSKAKMITLN